MQKVALITGVSSGIGRVAAARLAAGGFRTFGTVRADSPPQPNVELVRLDVRDPRSVEECVATVVERAGRIDVLVNNAGGALTGAAEETTIDEARALFETNFFGILRMTAAVLPVMRAQGGGRIINVSSVLGFLPAPFMSIYAATKHALEGYSESLDHEVRGFGVHVALVEPAFTKTGLGHNGNLVQHTLPQYDDARRRVAERVAASIERGADPSVVANVILRAATDARPRLRYQAGRDARLLRILRSLAPSSAIDSGTRKQFGLGAAS